MQLGHFDYRVVRAIEALASEATSFKMLDRLEKELEMSVNPGHMFRVLDNLCKAKFVQATSNQPVLFALTPKGLQAASRYRASLSG